VIFSGNSAKITMKRVQISQVFIGGGRILKVGRQDDGLGKEPPVGQNLQKKKIPKIPFRDQATGCSSLPIMFINTAVTVS